MIVCYRNVFVLCRFYKEGIVKGMYTIFKVSYKFFVPPPPPNPRPPPRAQSWVVYMLVEQKAMIFLINHPVSFSNMHLLTVSLFMLRNITTALHSEMS